MIRIVVLLLISLPVLSFAQQQDGAARLAKLLRKTGMTGGVGQRDDPQSRIEFDNLRLRNPNTEKVPEGIHQKEVQFFEQNLRKALASNARVADNLIIWKQRGPFNVGGRTRALAIDVSNEEVILAGGVSGGMWRSANGGSSWVKTTGSNELQSVTAVAQDTREGHTQTWYYATGENDGNSAGGFDADYSGDGIYKSTDGGRSWQILASTSTQRPEVFDHDFDYNHEIVVCPVTGDVVVANYGGIYISQDGGTSWDLSYASTGSGGWTDVLVDSQGIIYAFINAQGVIRSVDRGATWEDISASNFPNFATSHRGEIAIAPSNENILYLLAQTSNNNKGHALWRYDAATGTWANRFTGIPFDGSLTGDFDSQGGYDLLIKVKPDDENYVFIGGTNLHRSTDGFSTTSNTDWIGGYESSGQTYGQYALHHPDQHCLVFYPSNPNRALSGNDGGIQLTEDITANESVETPVEWIPLNNGYMTTQAYAVSIGPNDQVLAGFQDNGTWGTLTEDPFENWETADGGDGAYSAVSSDGIFKYTSSQYANVYRIEFEDGETFAALGYEDMTPEDITNPLFISPMYLDSQDDNIMYLGGARELFVNTRAETGNSSTGWKQIILPGNSGKISEMGVVGNGITYVGTSSGRLYKVSNVKGVPSVVDLTSSVFGGGYISGIGVNESNPDEVIVTLSSYEVKSIFHSTDGGQNWQHVSGNLEENEDGSGSGPSVRTAKILGNGDLYLVGTSVGLFTTKVLDGVATFWEQENLNSLGSAVVEHLAVRNSDGLVVVGTHGNGVFSANFPTTLSDLAVTNIESPKDGLLSGSSPIVTTITNVGSHQINAFTLKYSVDGQEVASEEVSETLQTGDNYTHSFATTFNFSMAGSYDLKIELSSTQDEVNANNVLEKTIQSYRYIDAFPYEEGFEDENHGWASTGLWEWGSPSTERLNDTYEGEKAWVTNLDGEYPGLTNAKLISPVFDLSGMEYPAVSFYINYDIEAEYDGVVLAYRTDLNSRVFTVIDENKGLFNWYPAKADVFGYEAWTGTTSGYVQATAELTFLKDADTVQFAFIFASDPFEVGEGFAVDNFRLYEDISVLNDVFISSKSIAENNLLNQPIGTFNTPGANGGVTYSFASGEGDADNGSFGLFGSQLVAGDIFNFEVDNLYTIRVKATDSQAKEFFGTFGISVEDQDDPPSKLTISESSIDEGNSLGATVGLLSVEDEDVGETYSFALFSGNGSTNNSSFGIFENELRASERFDHEARSSYIVRVQATSADNGATITETFDISVTDVNEPPTDLQLSRSTIPDGKEAGYVIGNFSAKDGDGDNLDFALVSGDGDDDNPKFTISGTELVTNESASLAGQQLYRILVEANDGRGAFVVSPFEISVTELLALINLAKMGITLFPNPASDYMNIKIANEYTGQISLSITTLEGKVVLRQSLEKSDFILKQKLDVSHFTKGVYLVNFQIGDRLVSGRLIRE